MLDEAGARRPGGAPEVRLAPGAVEEVAAAHARAASVLGRPAEGAPGEVDAGVATAAVHRLLVGLATAGDDLAQVHVVVATLVRGVERRIADTDHAVAAALLELRSAA